MSKMRITESNGKATVYVNGIELGNVKGYELVRNVNEVLLTIELELSPEELELGDKPRDTPPLFMSRRADGTIVNHG